MDNGPGRSGVPGAANEAARQAPPLTLRQSSDHARSGRSEDAMVALDLKSLVGRLSDLCCRQVEAAR